MPRALTLEQKRERNMNSLVESIEPTTVVRDTSERVAGEQKRRTRGAFNGTTGKLSINHAFLSPDYHYHWLNDSPGRIDQALENGYEMVTSEEIGGGAIERLVGVQDSGEPLKAYFMKIRIDWYNEDQAALQNRVDRVDHAIKTGRNAKDTEGFYTPQQGIKIKSSDQF